MASGHICFFRFIAAKASFPAQNEKAIHYCEKIDSLRHGRDSFFTAQKWSTGVAQQ